MTEQRLVDTYTNTETNVLWWSNYVQRHPLNSAYVGLSCASPAVPVVVVTPVYSGDTAAVGELADETPTERTDWAGE